MKIKMLLIIGFIFLSAALVIADDHNSQKGGDKMSEEPYLSIPFETIDGKPANLKTFSGKVLLLVNTASKCGFTPQYAGLEELYRKYKDKGLVIIGFPANNFLKQEPGTNEQIAEFCQVNYGVTFPMMAKISVKGKDIHPLYAFLTNESPYPGKISWNFNKFLLDRHGKVVNRFGSKTKPLDKDLVSSIESLLGAD